MEETKTTLPLAIEPKTIVKLVEDNLPEMIRVRDNMVNRMSQITTIADEEEEESVTAVLVASKKGLEKITEHRKAITEPLDAIKKQAMTYEKEATEQDTRLRGLLQQFKQSKLDAQKEVERQAAAKKAKENHKVDLSAQVKKNLTAMVITLTKESDDYSKGFFDKATVDNFDSEATKFKGIKPRLKEDKYNACFAPAYNRNIITDEEFKAYMDELKQTDDLSYASWSLMAVETIVSVLNRWRAQIDDIKAEKITIAKAKGEEKERLEKEKAERDAAEQERKQKQFDDLQKKAEKQISEETELGKMNNSFVEQVTVQSAGDKGLVKKVIKFSDRTKEMKALCTIIAHCMAHKDFPGFQKRDKNKIPDVDDQGRPVYIDPVQWWINFFIAKCDADIDGTVVFEDSKVIVRK